MKNSFKLQKILKRVDDEATKMTCKLKALAVTESLGRRGTRMEIKIELNGGSGLRHQILIGRVCEKLRRCSLSILLQRSNSLKVQFVMGPASESPSRASAT